MNKRQKKKLYKRLYGHNPSKNAPVQRPSNPFDFSGMTEAKRAFVRKMGEIVYEIAKAAEKVAITFLEAATAHMDDPAFRKMVNIAVEENRRAFTEEAAQMMIGEKPLPCIVTAESLTAQRMAGKRRKKNHKKRRI